jgi:hypothetical protein
MAVATLLFPIDATNPKSHPLVGQLDRITAGSDFRQPPPVHHLLFNGVSSGGVKQRNP